jgi:hypothetical protein
MKTLHLPIIMVCLSGSLCVADTNQPPIVLTGIVSLPDFKCALLDVSKVSWPGTEHIILGEGQRDEGVEVSQVDCEKGIAQVRYQGTAMTLKLSDEVAAGSPSIRLQKANVQHVLDLYVRLADVNVLRCDGVKTRPLSLIAAARTKAEARTALEGLFRTQGFASVPTGEKFVVIAPNEFTNALVALSRNIPSAVAADASSWTGSADESIPLRGIRFKGAPAEQILVIYEDYTGRKFANRESVRPTTMMTLMFFENTTALRRSEVCYALEMLLACNRIKIDRNNDGTFNAQPFDPRVAP